LIAMRKAHPAFRMTSQDMVQKNLKFLDMKTPNVVAYTLDNNANKDSWKQILVIFNGNRKPVGLQIPEGTWNVVCYNGAINPSGVLMQVKGPKLNVPASSAAIMYFSEEKP